MQQSGPTSDPGLGPRTTATVPESIRVLHQAPRTQASQPPTAANERPALFALPKLYRRESGLQLATDNPAWAIRARASLAHLPVRYRVRLARPADDHVVARLVRGVTEQGDFLAAADASLPSSEPAGDWIEVTMNHGRGFLLRRLLQAFGLPPRETVRTQVGPISLGDLSLNEERPLTPNEWSALPTQLRTGL